MGRASSYFAGQSKEVGHTPSGHEISGPGDGGGKARAKTKQLLSMGGERVKEKMVLCPMDTCTLWRYLGEDWWELTNSYPCPSRKTEETQTRSMGNETT